MSAVSTLVDLVERELGRDHMVDLDLARQMPVDDLRQFGAASRTSGQRPVRCEASTAARAAMLTIRRTVAEGVRT